MVSTTFHCPVCGRDVVYDMPAVSPVEVVTVTTSGAIAAPAYIEKLVIASNAITLTMPNPALCVGRKITIKQAPTSNNIITINPYASEHFQDDVQYESMTIEDSGSSITFIADTDWQVVRGF